MTRVFEDRDDVLSQKALDTARGLNAAGMSIREISRQSGVPYSTLQGVLQIGGAEPSETTVARLEAWAGRLPAVTEERGAGWRTDAPFWDDNRLARLQPPAGATHFRLVVDTPEGTTPYTSTGYEPLFSVSPFDLAIQKGIDARAVARVVWTRAGSLGRAP